MVREYKVIHFLCDNVRDCEMRRVTLAFEAYDSHIG